MADKSRPELSVDNEAGFCSFFRSLPAKDASTIRIFERGDYYSVHGEDAHYIAQNVYRTTTVIKYLGSSDPARGIPSCTLSNAAFAVFLREALTTRGMRVEIWGTAGRNSWALTKQASPGNLQDVEDLIFGNTDLTSNPVILAVKVQATATQRSVGVAFADASVRELGVSEFVDNDLYSNFESLLIQLGVKECIIQEDPQHKDYDLGKLRQVVDRCGITITEKRSADFSARDIEQDLTRLLGGDLSAGTLPQFDLKLAMASASALIKYLALMSDSTNFGQYELYQHDLSQYMKLDASAVRALNLMPGPNDGANKNMSLFGLLNKCRTAIGTRLLAQWLKQPLMNIHEIEKRHSLVEIFVEDTELRQTLQEEQLKAIPDLNRLAKRFQKGLAGLEDVIRVYQVVIRLPGILATLEASSDEEKKALLQDQYITKLAEHAENLGKLQELVETTIDLEALDDHEFRIKADFDENLQHYRQRLEELREEMNDEHQRVGQELDQDTDKKLKMEQHKVYGWCLRLTRNESGAIRGKRGYIELATQKAGVHFTTNKLQELSREFADTSNQYDRQQSSLVKEVVSIVASYCGVFELLSQLIAHLDVIVAFAHVSVHAPTGYVRPRMLARGEGDMILKDSRHPCLEMQDDVDFIANDVTLKRGESEFLIITGPNMGGKSTYIRQIGVIALMAQAGCFVPCSEAEICVFDCILSRVGAGDSQLKGVSTFMAEMLETATILKSATKDSLIIIDELGRGTSILDGAGLAWAISEHIVKEIKCFALFATHFHELTALADSCPQVKNLHVVVHVEEGESRDITLLYKVDEGAVDESFGIHVAKLARFPEKVVKMAKRKADELEDFSGKHDEKRSKCTKEEVAEGSNLLKEVMTEWKSKVDTENMSAEEMIEIFQATVAARKEALDANAFVKEALTLA
ncbi:putative DNA mismatch repair protein Msh2 [Saitoella complicata NRRL Y-17804]|uniref:DNA mismatch repair proteins mutS family domain-containing protein n=1 Tax=Saitoella complicata (strain BCRC 22490 / CBS 7301 / JCM 7358 / NBRC 10748 / NRRL Y-17804) TaxID=698492 RepID=A0A0E9NRT0_SAICN|nr:putative DNA mismatch repair protein Msh2 [Saitoella complicata NRRL Y-17804]ODQ56427.1 putative DNA mismatch repair protein Msh2 [Saitoella complicata NRRL Y-17804]GAO52574.1 hypothetical protein G7K_6647-t1 [Saitoella complicata NRRL Y-17804]